MSTVLSGTTSVVAASGSSKPARFSFNFSHFTLALLVVTAMFIAARTYQQIFGMSMGLDATSPEFAAYWLTFFKIELPILWGSGVACWLYLFKTRDRNIEAVKPAVELQRYFALTGWLVAYSFTIYWTGSFFAEGDGMWHQTTLRDTPLTPSHIILFYGCIPVYLFFGIGSFVYAMTRIPAFCKGISLMHVFAVTGPFMLLPNLGFNEWGHAYWLTEEIFSHPLHWGFVVLGWCALALPAVALQMLARMRVLFREVFGTEQDSATTTRKA